MRHPLFFHPSPFKAYDAPLSSRPRPRARGHRAARRTLRKCDGRPPLRLPRPAWPKPEPCSKAARFGEALAILRPLTTGRTVHADVLFLIGLAATGASQQPGGARGRTKGPAGRGHRRLPHPAHRIARSWCGCALELARAFFLRGRDFLARRHFEQVLAGNLPPPVVANVQRFLFQIRARKRWRVYFGAALAPDSNIGAASDERFIDIHIGGVPLPFRRNEEELTTSGVGLSLWTGGEYQRPLGERVRLRAGGDVSRREYPGGNFDQDQPWRASGSALARGAKDGPEPARERRVEASLRGTRRLRRPRGPSRRRTGVSPRGCRSPAGRRGTTAATGEDGHLDGPARDFSLSGSWVVAPTVRLDGGARGTAPCARSGSATGARAAGCGWGPRWPCRGGFAVGASAQVRWTDYEGEWAPPTPRRR